MALETNTLLNKKPQHIYAMSGHIFQWYIYLFTALAAASQMTEGWTQKHSPVSNERKSPLMEVGSSTKNILLLHMTLIIENLLQQWHPKSIITNSCP